MRKFFTTLARLSILFLFTFEVLNWVRILHYSLDFTWFGLIITAVIAWTIIECLNYYFIRRTGHGLPGAVMLIAGLALYIDALGDILRFYSTYSWYDQTAHLANSVAVAAVALTILLRKKINFGRMGTGILSISIATSFGVLYELEEYLEDYFTGSNRLGPGTDTVDDLLWNLIGALIIVVLYFTFKHKEINN